MTFIPIHINEVCFNIADNLLAVTVYVAFRSPHPDAGTMKDVLKEMEDNNIEVKHLEMWSANHCQEVESSTKRGRSS